LTDDRKQRGFLKTMKEIINKKNLFLQASIFSTEVLPGVEETVVVKNAHGEKVPLFYGPLSLSADDPMFFGIFKNSCDRSSF